MTFWINQKENIFSGLVVQIRNPSCFGVRGESRGQGLPEQLGSLVLKYELHSRQWACSVLNTCTWEDSWSSSTSPQNQRFTLAVPLNCGSQQAAQSLQTQHNQDVPRDSEIQALVSQQWLNSKQWHRKKPPSVMTVGQGADRDKGQYRHCAS